MLASTVDEVLERVRTERRGGKGKIKENPGALHFLCPAPGPTLCYISKVPPTPLRFCPLPTVNPEGTATQYWIGRGKDPGQRYRVAVGKSL